MNKESSNKRYYWLKLKDNFFTQPKIKKLRRIAGGDTYTIIYLKLQLLSLENCGVLVYEGIESTFAEEMALKMDEDTDNVTVAIEYLLTQDLLEESDSEYILPETIKLIGSETASTIRSQKSREKKKLLQCNSDATNCNGETRHKEIEIEKDIETRLIECHIGPTLSEIIDEIEKKGYKTVTAKKFYDCYSKKGWSYKGKAITDWKALLKSWEDHSTYLHSLMIEEEFKPADIEEIRRQMFGKEKASNVTV